ncbi:MAG: hypothetical protein Q8P22_14425, partial [Chloroflexota bacterium]|nr:hypothetical protein [Chloroflexota bacterium]
FVQRTVLSLPLSAMSQRARLSGVVDCHEREWSATKRDPSYLRWEIPVEMPGRWPPETPTPTPDH